MKRESKHDEIRQALKRGETITGIKAMNEFNVYRLSSVINRLRNEGLAIKTEMIVKDDSTTFAKYWIPINERINAN